MKLLKKKKNIKKKILHKFIKKINIQKIKIIINIKKKNRILIIIHLLKINRQIQLN